MEKLNFMKKDIKTKWVKALRSGKYKQAAGKLKDDNGYCCLGVLCQLHAKETKLGKWITTDNEYYPINYVVGKSVGDVELPTAVMKWAGLSRPYGISVKGSKLTNINDNEGKTFKELADIIEENA